MRFKGTSGELYGELLAKVEREKMRSAGLEVERDSLMRCCNELQEELEQSRQREAAKDAVLGRAEEMLDFDEDEVSVDEIRTLVSMVRAVLRRDERGES